MNRVQKRWHHKNKQTNKQQHKTKQNKNKNKNKKQINKQKRWRLKCDVIKFSFLHFSFSWPYFSRTWWKPSHLTWNSSWWPEVWPHEYLFSSIEVSVNWPFPNSFEPGQFALISMGLIRHSCGHISGHHELFHLRVFFIMFYWNMVMKMLKLKKNDDVTLQYSIILGTAKCNAYCHFVKYEHKM